MTSPFYFLNKFVHVSWWYHLPVDSSVIIGHMILGVIIGHLISDVIIGHLISGVTISHRYKLPMMTPDIK
jgi:hypothetical protein